MSDKARLFPHYFKATEHLDEVDVYQVLKLFDPQDPSTALGHAVKKILLPGSRGSKGRKQDIEEAIASLQRYLDINYGDSSRASHEKKAELVREYEDLRANIPSLRGEQDLRAGIAGLKTPTDKVEVSYREPPAGMAALSEKLHRFERAYQAYVEAEELTAEKYAAMFAHDWLLDGAPCQSDPLKPIDGFSN